MRTRRPYRGEVSSGFRFSHVDAIVIAIMFSMAASCALPASAAPSTLPDQPGISTLAGSGATGIADGSAAVASFVSPTGLAFASDGTLYVADRGAQRIRRVDPDGRVTTVAGSGNLVPLGIGVPGGFANGAAAAAKFDEPESLAVESDGTILVADTLNSCIRSIARGTVATFAGRCRAPGGGDGPAASASFGQPRSIAVDSKGVVFVVDPPNGIRRIANGVVSTLKTAHGTDAIAIATVSQPANALLVAVATLIDVIDPETGVVRAELPLETSFINGASREGLLPVGPATGIAGFAADDFVYADPYDGAVFLAQSGAQGSYLRLLGGQPPLEAPVLGSSFRDGPGGTGLFDEPYTVAIAPDGRVAVADLGNRRIRILTRFNHDTVVQRQNRSTELPETPDAQVVRVALVGNSYVGTNQGWDDSIAGEFQQFVNASRTPNQKRIVVYPFMRAGTTVFDLLSLIDGQLSDGIFDDVIVDVPDRGQLPDRTGASDALFPDGWPLKARAALLTEKNHLAADKTKLIALLYPGPLDFQDEMAYRYVYKGPASSNPYSAPIEDPAKIQGFRDDVIAAVRDSGVPAVDCWPSMVSDHDLTVRESLYGSWDHHFTPHGRSMVARALADYFLRTLP